MFQETVGLAAKKALEKRALLSASVPRYLFAAGLAGVYVGLGIILIFSVGAPLAASGSAVTSMVMGLSFGIALTLVIFAGAELFTGNNMYFTVAPRGKYTSWKDTLRKWFWCYSGNLLGAVFFCLLIVGTGRFDGIKSDHLLFVMAA